MVVGVEGGQHDHRGRVLAGAQLLGGGEPVHPRHPDVHQHDVGRVGVDRGGHLGAVGDLGHHADVVGAGQHHRQRRAHERVVVDEQDADRRAAHAGHGSQARSSKSPPGVRPCSSRPPASAGALGQADQPGAGARDRRPAAAPTGSRLRTSTVSPVAGGAVERHVDRRAVRVLARVGQRPPARSGRRCARRRRAPRRGPRPGTRSSRACRPARDSSSRPGRLASVGCGRSGSPSSDSSRSTPITSRRSSSAWWALARITPAARAISSGGASGRNSSAPACMLSSEIRWASTSCISRAMRARSCGLRLLDAQLLLGLGALARARAATARAGAARARTCPTR